MPDLAALTQLTSGLSPEMLEQLSLAAPLLSPEQAQQVADILLGHFFRDKYGWPLVYINSDTNKVYTPHHPEEDLFVQDHHSWRYGLASGGEGGGKSVCGIIKTLSRLRTGCDGMLVSPNLPHFQRSTWKEFQRWCPWDKVIPSHRRMADKGWMPVKPFDIVFDQSSNPSVGDNYLHCVGAKDVGSLEGPNINFVHFDEARHFPDAGAVKVLDGRVRIDGPQGEKPQMWFTTTRRMHWLFDYFGPLKCVCKGCGQKPMTEEGIEGVEVQRGKSLLCPNCGSQDLDITDTYASFKLSSKIISLPTAGNAMNLTADFAELRAQTLTSAEIDVLLRDLWRSIQEGQPFLPDILWWDKLREDIPLLTPRDPLILALDAATGRQLTSSDCFAILGITPHPDPARWDTDVAVRYTHTWQAAPGMKIDFDGTPDDPGPVRTLLNLCGYGLDHRGGIITRPDIGYRVLKVVYDPTELHSVATRLRTNSVVGLREFTQSLQRNEADRLLLDMIAQGRVAHDGDLELRQHLRNADRKLDSTGRRLRIVKRTERQRVDLAVCLSMACFERTRLNL